MEIYLMRHGTAEPGRLGRPDRERELTLEGRQKVAAVMRSVSQAMMPATLLSSPYTRALQTAAIANEELRVVDRPLEITALTPESTPHEAWNAIREHPGEGGVLAVLHEPLISALAAFLLCSPGIAIEFDTATIIAIETTNAGPQPRGVLKWMANGNLPDRPNETSETHKT